MDSLFGRNNIAVHSYEVSSTVPRRKVVKRSVPAKKKKGKKLSAAKKPKKVQKKRQKTLKRKHVKVGKRTRKEKL